MPSGDVILLLEYKLFWKSIELRRLRSAEPVESDQNVLGLNLLVEGFFVFVDPHRNERKIFFWDDVTKSRLRDVFFDLYAFSTQITIHNFGYFSFIKLRINPTITFLDKMKDFRLSHISEATILSCLKIVVNFCRNVPMLFKLFVVELYQGVWTHEWNQFVRVNSGVNALK
jgi:hypothetical protein